MTAFVILGVAFVISFVALFLAKNREVVKFALDTTKTLMGFFIGVVSAFLGLPVPAT